MAAPRTKRPPARIQIQDVAPQVDCGRYPYKRTVGDRIEVRARIFRDVTRENVGKRMAILLFEKGKGEVVTAPVIRGEIGGG